MKPITNTRLRWRIMIGLGTQYDGTSMDASWARETALNVANALDAFSITDGLGAWRGKQEPSLTIEYIGEDHERERIHVIANTIARYLNQEEIWVSEEPITLTRIAQ